MSYPPPPGLKASQSSGPSTSQTHSSLPARPPPPSAGFPSNAGKSQPPVGFGGFTAFKPRSVASAPSSWQSQPPNIQSGPVPAPAYAAAPSPYPAPSYGAYPQAAQYNAQATYAQPTPPQIRNPFPLPGQDQSGRGNGGDRYGNASYDPELEAQIAQWQSAYAGKEEQNTQRGSFGKDQTGANTVALGTRPGTNAPFGTLPSVPSIKADGGSALPATKPDGSDKTVLRSGGGQTWQDPSLLEWDPAHFRLFVGNLAGEVTDESLLKAFSKYETVQKARVVRDKRSTKSKGFGFVSFSDGDQYFQAAKEMQGKYIGSHPVLLRKSTTEIKAVNPNDKKKNKHGKGAGGQGGGGSGNAHTHAGVHKKPKTKGGLKILG